MGRKASRSKVARLIDEYDLAGIGDELEDRWTRPEDREGLRQLADYFNRRLLEAALASGSTQPLDGEVENLYRLLTDDDVSSGIRTETRNRLEGGDVDVERLEDDFVSRQAIDTYLTGYRDATAPADDTSPSDHRDRRLESIQRLTSRLATVTERALDDLTSAGRLTLGEFNVLVTVRVHCTDCGTQLHVRELLTEGACNCESSRV